MVARNDPCPCGSGKKYKNCHGEGGLPHQPLASSAPPGAGAPTGVENPFRRIFKPDGSVNQEYVMKRLQHLESLLKENREFFPVRFDRSRLEEILSQRQDIFADSDDQEQFQEAFGGFAEIVLPELVTKEFDERVKEVFRQALHDDSLSRRDRAAAACGLVLTVPEDGVPAQPHHQNPFFDMVLRVTFNESMTRVEFLQDLANNPDMPEAEREARIQEFLRSVPALLYELHEGMQKRVKRALKSYQRGDFSFGIGMDMLIHGLRTIRTLTQEYDADGGEEHTDEENRAFAERLGKALRDAFAEDIAEEETEEILNRMGTFLAAARDSGATRAANGLSAALEVMHQDLEVRHRMILAAYHEAVTGRRIFRDPAEEEAALALFEDPMDLERYLAYGKCLEDDGSPARAERVYLNALECFPEAQEVRERLQAIAEQLEPERRARVVVRIRETEAAEAEEE